MISYRFIVTVILLLSLFWRGKCILEYVNTNCFIYIYIKKNTMITPFSQQILNSKLLLVVISGKNGNLS